VDRIEILRGSAPVMYGATSFVGVIHVLHRQAGEGEREVRLTGGSYGSGSASFSSALPEAGGFQQSIAINGEQHGFKDDRTEFTRGHLLYRATRGGFRFDLDGTILAQDPASPHPRVGTGLTPLVPLDANHNPSDAKIDENRLHFVSGYDRTLGQGNWSTTLSLTRSERDTVRGFLNRIAQPTPANPNNARGYEQDLSIIDVYFDTHVVLHPQSDLQLILGFDHLYGRAEGEAEDFDYGVNLNGSGAPDSSSLTRRVGFEVEDERNFSGLYAQGEWNPVPRLRFLVGARLNHTAEDREAEEEPLAGEEPGEEEEEGGSDSRTVTRGSGTFGINFLAWERDDDAIWLYTDYRNTYKPAAIDFGPEAEPDILEPETAVSYEVGAKGRHFGGRLDWDVSAFQMDFENLVLSQVVNGLPQLINAGSERFKGIELETRLLVRTDLSAQLAYSWHEAQFRDFLREFDGVPRQLNGNFLEMTAEHMGSAGVLWAPASGWIGSVAWNYVGERWLNQRNTALAPDYSTVSAGVGYRFSWGELRLDGENLNDTRPPVAESELGDAQYYRLPARSFRLGWASHF
ncbi:MAG TPA: TonB-dependent receptor, partial [Thermoanaerobaculia bacterium]|nr:TonB-dependent receptor [Thermoanaerobaculia bacterium]